MAKAKKQSGRVRRRNDAMTKGRGEGARRKDDGRCVVERERGEDDCGRWTDLSVHIQRDEM